MPQEPDVVTTIALLALVSFAIDRIVTGTLFILSFSPTWNRRFPETVLIKDARLRFHAEKKRKLIYFIFAGVLALGVLALPTNLRVLKDLGVRPTPEIAPTSSPSPNAAPPVEDPLKFRALDFFMTGLILLGGAEGIARLLKLPRFSADAPQSEQKPLEITGKIKLEEQEPK